MSEEVEEIKKKNDELIVNEGGGGREFLKEELVKKAKETEFKEHMSGNREYMRDMILGSNDGLVSIFLLIAGIVGGGLQSKEILIAGVAAAVAGAISMMAGEYLSTKSQEEVYDAEIAVEREHMKYFRDHEVQEARDMLKELGIEGELLDLVIEQVAADDERLMKLMLTMEFGILDANRRSPLKATIMIGFMFFLGSVPPIFPFVFPLQVYTAFTFSAILSAISLFIVGAAKTKVTLKNPWYSGLENFAIGAVGAIVSYIIGLSYGVIF